MRCAGELQHFQEVRGTLFVPSDEPAEAQQPREQPFDQPAPTIPSQRSAILRLAPSPSMMWGDPLDAQLGEAPVQGVAVVRPVTHETLRKRPNESFRKGVEDQSRFMPLPAGYSDGDGEPVAVGYRHALRGLASSRPADQSAPLFAPAWLPSMNASRRSRRPRWSSLAASPFSMRSSTPSRCHF
jgi:hypothetical protein